MNICFFSREYPPDTHVGGIGTYTYNMASALVRLGHTVHVITSTRNSERDIVENGVHVHRVRSRKLVPKELAQIVYSRRIARKVSQLECRFDVVHSSEYASEAFCFALRKKYPLVTRLATPFYLAQKLDGQAITQPRPLRNYMERKQTLLSDGIFASTRALAKEVIKKWKIDPERVEVIPNSVDISRIQRLGTGRPAPENLKDLDYILYFGRLEIRKGVLVLTEALPLVLERFPQVKMVFVGSDSLFRGLSLRQHILKQLETYKDRVIFFDNQPQESLFPIVNAAKIVVLPSLWEAFGFVTVETMALGRPLIATSGSGFEEIIEDGISGYLVKPGNSDSLASRIIGCLKDCDGLGKISQGAQKRAQEYEVSSIAHRLLGYYERIRSEQPGLIGD